MKIKILIYTLFIFFTSCENQPVLVFNTKTLEIISEKGFMINKVEVTNNDGIKDINDVLEINCNDNNKCINRVSLSQKSLHYSYKGKLLTKEKNEVLYFRVFVSQIYNNKQFSFHFVSNSLLKDTVIVITPFRIRP